MSIRSLPRRTVGEWEVTSTREYENPFVDVEVIGRFISPSGREWRVPGFYDGDGVWKVRFNPGEEGRWAYRLESYPEDPELRAEGTFEVLPREARGFLRSVPGQAWGFIYESGEPVFILGDTVYNLFGMAHCGADVEAFLERRASQGFNLLRVRVPVSPFHPPKGYSEWQTRRTWPWEGSEQAPVFDRFNLEYFATVDRVVRKVEELGLGLEVIMEAWGFEFPFNSRHIFVAEWEELWMRYLVARYDAYSCVYFWTPMNEYEFYPNGDWHYKPTADRWAIRIARWLRANAPHGHIVSLHNGPWDPPFAHRFRSDPKAIDTIMFQFWGTTGRDDAWLAAGIEDRIAYSLGGWYGTAVFAEYGYERNPALPLNIPGHEFCDPEHTRRGAWRGAFCGLGVIHGFENSWGPFMVLEEDQPGLEYLLHLRRFFTEVVPFHRLLPDASLVVSDISEQGGKPLALSSPERDVLAVYLPRGGEFKLSVNPPADPCWYDPRTGEVLAAEASPSGGWVAPQSGPADRPHDWVWFSTSGR
ncbi:hypothetical protein Tter_1998 [Thermobaculum terrenum ATCC BAA-798]|uniref:DUF4038 domain-containing protein n=1 Tax=Thermobaculum terrenum (strain ATCC BAA-798 / CCMEE 7001 / YNP1) TaxID=525904 RepID=D1CGN1_THET1|nr:DUF4038 domain-containing protein [Thermobaculum terrenum]ACZ42902.1 hypothetical protein Tter_1998 [Thermobaculum terrenum ATCC BAA-798]